MRAGAAVGTGGILALGIRWAHASVTRPRGQWLQGPKQLLHGAWWLQTLLRSQAGAGGTRLQAVAAEVGLKLEGHGWWRWGRRRGRLGCSITGGRLKEMNANFWGTGRGAGGMAED